MDQDGRPISPPGGWSRQPLRFDGEHFLRTGTVLVGDRILRDGMPREEVRSLVPEPITWVPTSDGAESDCWTWGALDLLFTVEDTVRLYSDDLDRLTDLGGVLRADPRFLRHHLPTPELRTRLTAAGIAHALFLSDDGLRGLAHLPAAGVWLHLEAVDPAPTGIDGLVLEAFVSGGDPRRGERWTPVD